jgi:hypothetical protein
MFSKFKEAKTKEQQATSEELAAHANKVMETLDEGNNFSLSNFILDPKHIVKQSSHYFHSLSLSFLFHKAFGVWMSLMYFFNIYTTLVLHIHVFPASTLICFG